MKRILIVEDGTEYLDAFTRLSTPGSATFVRTGSLSEALARLDAEPFDGLFLDVVFDRTPVDELAGDLDALITRFGGDRERAVRQLAENQGFYVLDALAPRLAPEFPVVIAYDFSDEPQRYERLRKRVPRLSGLPDGASISKALEML